MDEDELSELLAPPEIPRDMVVRTLGLKRAIEVGLHTLYFKTLCHQFLLRLQAKQLAKQRTGAKPGWHNNAGEIQACTSLQSLLSVVGCCNNAPCFHTLPALDCG